MQRWGTAVPGEPLRIGKGVLTAAAVAVAFIALAGACGGGDGGTAQPTTAAPSGSGEGSGTGSDAAASVADLKPCDLLSVEEVSDAAGKAVKVEASEVGSCTFGSASGDPQDLFVITVLATESELAGDLKTSAQAQAEFGGTTAEAFDGLSTDAYTYSIFGSATLVFEAQGHSFAVGVTGTENDLATAQAVAELVLGA